MLLVVLPGVVGCEDPETGEYRKGRYGWARAAKPGELDHDDLLGIYSCSFRNGSSEIQLRRDGTYLLTVRSGNNRRVAIGPFEWYTQDLDDTAPMVVLKQLPILLATMETPITPEEVEKAQKGTGDFTGCGAPIGYNSDGVIVLGIGVDPDNDYYFAREDPRGEPE